jgi:DHA2 family multidrug resistance protein
MNAERAMTQAYALLYRTVTAQASTLAYIDTFFILAAGAGIMFLLSFTLRKNDPGGRRVVME